MNERLTDKLHEECGVIGIFNKGEISDVVMDTYYGLYALQHRGQESCGIAVNDDGVISCRKDLGLVNEVFTKDVLEAIPRGKMTVGHCRYATTGTLSAANAQPLVLRHIKGNMALAHNGNLTNATELREEVELTGAIFHTTSDTEVIAYAITKERLTAPSIQDAVVSAMYKLKGAYSLVIMSPRKLIAARDPLGFRPLCMGKIGESIIFASESCALDSIGATFVRDIEPGEVVVVTDDGVESIKTHCGKGSGFCVFEYIYFARPDSVINGSSVHTARKRAGALLALAHPVEADVVIGVPDSGIDAALGYATQSGIPYGLGFLKNKYIGRTFIAPSQQQREDAVRIKLNPISATVKGKRVIIIDDSIVRGTTSLKIVKLLREAG
ncbi:MAG: amidophosphoribosyltransferase, partial [Oscillospiraceae bacterium]